MIVEEAEAETHVCCQKVGMAMRDASCIGKKCMAWRWATLHEVLMSFDVSNDQVRAYDVEHDHDEVECPETRKSKDFGYCGLAGNL